MSTDTTTETTGQRRLREARERVAALEAASAPTLRLPQPGETIHCLETGLTISTGGGWVAGGAVLNRGQNLTVTAALLEANRDAAGNYNGPGLAHDPEAQQRVHGRLLFAPGPAPKDMVPERDTPTWREAREQARLEAWAQPSAEAQRAALAEVERRFGPPVSTATYTKINDPSIAAAEAQQKELDEGGVRLKWHAEAKEAGVTGERR